MEWYTNFGKTRSWSNHLLDSRTNQADLKNKHRWVALIKWTTKSKYWTS